MITRFEWTNARSIDDAIGQLNDKSLAKAGGVDLMDRLKEGLDSPSRLVNIRSIPDLDYVKEESGWLRLGPMVTLTTIAEHPVIRQRYTVLADAALNAATPHIRNMATV
ncbi:MAG: FAD binding domain-containing protein, partial [Acidobacteriota bacterium]